MAAFDRPEQLTDAFVTRRGPQGWQIVAATNVTEAFPPGR